MIVPFDDLTGKTRADIVKGYLDLGFDQETADAYTAVLLDEPDDVVKSVDSITISIAKATELAEGHPQFQAELAKVADDGLAFVKVSYDAETDDIVVSQPTGVMVAVMLDNTWPKLDFEGGVPDPHITLYSLGNEADLSLNDKRALIGVVNEVAKRHTQLHGVIGGTGYFADSRAWYTVPSVPGLAELRDDLAASLRDAGLPVNDTYDSFTPHVTLAYVDEEPDVDVAPFDLFVTQISAVAGGYRFDARLQEPEDAEFWHSAVPDGQTTPYVPIVKAMEEKRFTLAPMYIPGQLDAHGDWATDDDLQKALWDFNRGERMIALQHCPEVGPMGEAVEMMVVPWAMDVPMYKADGTSYVQHFPANTPWLGVVWTEDAWPLVKKGLVRGYSIGGKANLLDVALPEAVEVLKGK